MIPMPSPRDRFFPTDAGIAIGAILFIVAMLAVIAAVIAAGTGDFGTASIADRITSDITTQANLIRAKILECNTMYGTNANNDGYPASGGGVVDVGTLECAGDPAGAQNLWSGERPAELPPPTTGFADWQYINTNGSGFGGTATGGRCIYAEPTVSNPNQVAGIVSGLTKAASRFRSATSYTVGNEVIYDPASASQKFVVWITYPTGTPDSACLP
jgi:hypothetical protein